MTPYDEKNLDYGEEYFDETETQDSRKSKFSQPYS